MSRPTRQSRTTRGSSKTKTKVTATKTVRPVRHPPRQAPVPRSRRQPNDDYDNPLITGMQSVTPSIDDSTIGVVQSPALIDGYLR